MELRQKLRTSFGLGPGADNIVGNDPTASGLQFPARDSHARGVFRSPVRRRLADAGTHLAVLARAKTGENCRVDQAT
jgi:hypothetical protein